MMRRPGFLNKILMAVPVLAAFLGCASIDCPLNSNVVSTWNFYNSEGESVTLTDSLYVIARTSEKDTVLINCLYNATGFSIPLSYFNSTDTYVLEIHMPDTIWSPTSVPDGKTLEEIDGVQYYTTVKSSSETVTLSKTNTQYLDSPSCGVRVYHHLEDVSCQGVFLDSITIKNPTVDNNEQENLRIYFK